MKEIPDSPRSTGLPDAELEVMACLWRRQQATAREIREALHQFRPMAHGSVCTLLSRLESKGLVTRERGAKGKAFVYRPRVRPTRTYRSLLNNLIERVFGGSGVALVASLFETQPPTPQEIDKLQELLDGLRRANEGGGRP
jgi:predicted transcriptional regulator